MDHRRALSYMHLSAILFGISGIFGKLISSDAAVIAGGRSIFALLALSLMLWQTWRFPWQGIKPKQILSLCFCGLLLGMHWITFFIAIKVSSVAIATLGFACFPAFVAMLEGTLYGEKLSTTEYWLITLITLGLVLITPSFDFSNQATLGLLWGVLSGLIYAILTLVNRQSAVSIPGTQVCWWQNFTVIILFAPFIGYKLPEISAWDWLWIACLGLFCTGLAYSLFIISLQVLKARVAAMIIALEPVYAIAGAWILFDEMPNLRMVLGGVLIICAVLWSARRRR